MPYSIPDSGDRPGHIHDFERRDSYREGVRWQRAEIIYPQAVRIEENIALAPYTTLRIGGPARYLATARNEAELLEAVKFAEGKGLPIFVLGGGSNLVVADQGFDGVVIRIAIAAPSTVEEANNRVTYIVAAGTDWDEFVLDVCSRGLSGVECLAGIPGMVGGTPVQNVGAYGQEVAETIVSVRALDLNTGRFVVLSGAECGFGYRRSIFNSTTRGRYILTAVDFRFQVGREVELKYAELKEIFTGTSPMPLDVYAAVRELRRGKGMLLVEGEADCRSAGSFFKNPAVSEEVFMKLVNGMDVSAERVPHWPVGDGQVKLAAAWLLEQAGFRKGLAMGQAGISSRHTLALVNRGRASSAELLALRDKIRSGVAQRFGIELEQEPVMLG